MQITESHPANSLSSFPGMTGNPAFRSFPFYPLYFYSLILFVASFLFLPSNAHAKDKILSLDMCSDWMLAKYAEPNQVLALSPLTHQFSLEWIDNNLATHDGSLEQILDLKPDLVITGEYNAILLRQRLMELGLRVEILTLPKNLSQVVEYEKHLLKLIGRPFYENPQKTFTHIQDNSPRPRLLLLGANGIGTGHGTFENDILTTGGWDNYIKEDGYISLDIEKITADPPDAVLWSTPASVALSNLFAQHPALKKVIPRERWLTTTPWKWRCPGPWTRDLINELQAFLPTANQPRTVYEEPTIIRQ